GEARIAAEVTPGISNILHERFGAAGWPHIAAFVLNLLRGAELQADLAARVFLTDAGAHHIGDSFFDMEAQFPFEVGFPIVTPQPAPPIHCAPPSDIPRIRPTVSESRCQRDDPASRYALPLLVSR